MIPRSRPLADVSHDALRVLARELGVVETARFIGQFGAGRGDYTAERQDLFEGLSTEDWIERVRNVGAPRP